MVSQLKPCLFRVVADVHEHVVGPDERLAGGIFPPLRGDLRCRRRVLPRSRVRSNPPVAEASYPPVRSELVESGAPFPPLVVDRPAGGLRIVVSARHDDRRCDAGARSAQSDPGESEELAVEGDLVLEHEPTDHRHRLPERAASWLVNPAGWQVIVPTQTDQPLT